MSPHDPDPSIHAGRLALRDLAAGLAELRDGNLSTATFCARARNQTALRQGLPPRYDEVLLNLLDRLESSALFTEESCSFSQRELHDSLALWLDKARAELERAP